MFRGRRALLGLAMPWVFLVGCDNPVEVQPGASTLFVVNPLCAGSQCRPLQIRAFVPAFRIPQPAMGVKAVGEMTAGSQCFRFADSWELVVSDVDTGGRVMRSDTTTWTPDLPIYVTAVDWPETSADTAALGLVAATPTFVPADAPGWTVEFEESRAGGPPYTAVLAPGAPCVP